MTDAEDGCARRIGEGEIVGPYLRDHFATRAFSVRRLVNAPQDRTTYAADVAMMHRLITRGPRNAGEGMRLGSLKAKYRKEYAELRA